MKKVNVFSVAENDMMQIYDYIAFDNPLEASRMLDKFDKAFEQLGEFPQSGNLILDSRLIKKGYRKLVVGNYIIIYHETDSEVQILHIKNGAARYIDLL